MVVVSLYLFHGKFRLIAELTNQLATIFLLNSSAIVTIVCFILWKFLQTIACQVKTCIAIVTVKDLIRIIVEATKTYFTISLEKFDICAAFAFSWFD